MGSSIYLAKVIGLYLVFAGVSLLIFKERFKKLFKEALSNGFFINFSGFISFILGLLIVVAHPYWLGDWSVLITLFGWLLLFQGFMRVYFPLHAIAWAKNLTQSKAGLLWVGWVALLVGLYLTYVGFSFRSFGY
ncbi:MAG: hypothetical protein PVI40_08405 [Chlamydiota bacterium]|jgi:hypothetical protein